ncbi:unnamed protein product [Dibothriocephalus latus]|uniref:Uncharacterized protein n=1 Tax=Dibothriocephalus latus TaxID=60516 RepID=A0A3P6PKV4_DIBLA|nr:unnamed protein product [Dibothriocephalus latus]
MSGVWIPGNEVGIANNFTFLVNSSAGRHLSEENHLTIFLAYADQTDGLESPKKRYLTSSVAWTPGDDKDPARGHGKIQKMSFLVQKDAMIHCAVLQRPFSASTVQRECFRSETAEPRKWQVIDIDVAFIDAYIKTSSKFLGAGYQRHNWLVGDDSGGGDWTFLGPYSYMHIANNISHLSDRITAFTMSGPEELVDGRCKHLAGNWSGKYLGTERFFEGP